MPSLIGSTTKLPTSALPTRKQSYADISNCNNSYNNNSNNRTTPPRLKKTKSNQSLMSTSTTTSAASRPSAEYNNKPNPNSSRLRQPSPATSHTKLLVRSDSNSSLHQSLTINKKKSLPKIPPPLPTVTNSSSGNDEDDETKSFLTRTSSNGSTTTIDKRSSRRKSSLVDKRRKSIAAAAAVNDQCGDNFIMDMLKDELEREKSSSKALQGQKDGIHVDQCFN
jgi:hypothetical protein